MNQSNKSVRVCFVCLGNICRSPTAEGVFKKVARELNGSLTVDSAGTGGWHAGELADPRARRVAAEREIELTSRARRFEPDDFERFDYILAMDRENRSALEKMTNDPAQAEKVHLFRSFDSESPTDAEVPDPYYGGAQGFEDVFDMCERASKGFLEHLKESGKLS